MKKIFKISMMSVNRYPDGEACYPDGEAYLPALNIS